MIPPFTPGLAATVTVSVTSASAATALTGVGNQIRILHDGSQKVFFNVGDSTVTAAVATGTPIAPGGCEVFTIPATATHIACIAASGTETMYVTRGEGQ